MRAALLLAVAPWAAQAHFVWVEVPSRSELGKEQKVEVYFGEPHEFLREETGGRLDQHDGLRAWLVDPRGKRSEIALKKQRNRFSGTFTPAIPGRHNVEVFSDHHPVQDLSEYGGGKVRPLFYARGQTLAFDEGRVSEREAELVPKLDLDVIPVSRSLDPVRGTITVVPGQEFVVRVMYKGRPLAKRRVTALGPNGWSKELPVTDSFGVSSFVPLWLGRYVLVLTYDEKKESELRDERQPVIGHRATLSLVVDKRE